jgi:hypothetical protein
LTLLISEVHRIVWPWRHCYYYYYPSRCRCSAQVLEQRPLQHLCASSYLRLELLSLMSMLLRLLLTTMRMRSVAESGVQQ